MEINSKAPAIAQHEIIINASSDTIWALLANINQWNTWNPNISNTRLEGTLKPGAIFRWKSGGTAIVSTLQEVEPQRRMSLKRIGVSSRLFLTFSGWRSWNHYLF